MVTWNRQADANAARTGIVKELSGHVETDVNGSPLRSPDSVRSGGTQNNDSGHKHSGLDIPELDGEVPIEKDLGTLMLSDEGRSRYVHHNFFSRLTEEVCAPGLSMHG